jgi:hypothetical protein
MQIRKLLYEDGFTIAGARERLREEAREHRSQNPPANQLPPANQPLNQAADEVEPEARNESQAGLPFPVPPQRELRKAELQSLRRQLCEVLELLS